MFVSHRFINVTIGSAVYSTIIATVVFAAVLMPAELNAQSLVRGPYLQMASDNAITIKWRTSSATDSVVKYGNSPNNLDQTASIAGSRTNHEIRITGLNDDSQYYYSVGFGATSLAGGNSDYRFTTAPITGTVKSTRIWLIGDSGTANADAAAVYNAYLNYPGSDNTDLWIMLGDNAYNDGTDSQYQNAVFDMYPELLRRSTVWSTLGNHDGYSADSNSNSGPYYDIFSLPKNAESGGLPSGTEAYYSFDYGNIHFVCLDSYDSDRNSDGAMMTWLKNDLAATNQHWIIAFFHHPPYTKGSHNSDTEGELIDMREKALPILEDYGVDLVLSGHSHSYERSFLIDGHYGTSNTFNSGHQVDAGDGRTDGDGVYSKAVASTNAGTVYTVAGASGKISGGALNHPAMYTSLNQLGSVILDVSGNQIQAKHLRSDGVVTDYYTVEKGADVTSPTIQSIDVNSDRLLTVNLSEPILSSSADSLAQYSISGGVSVQAVSVSGNQIELSVSALTENKLYTLTVNGLTDIEGNKIANNSQVTFEYVNIQTMVFQQAVEPTENYSGTEDTYVASGNSDGNFGNETSLLADGDDGGNGELAALIRWDLNRLPSDITLIEAAIELNVFNPSTGSYQIYANTQTWSEATATWAGIDPLNSRGDQLAAFNPSSAGTYTIPLNSAGVQTLQSWLDGAVNHGFLMMSGGAADGIDIYASEYAQATARPKLSVTYRKQTVVGEPNRFPNAAFVYSGDSFTVNFSDTSSDSDGTIVSWLWQFGDGQMATSQNPSHSFESSGRYRVMLTVTDNHGAEDTIEITVDVTPSGAVMPTPAPDSSPSESPSPSPDSSPRPDSQVTPTTTTDQQNGGLTARPVGLSSGSGGGVVGYSFGLLMAFGGYRLRRSRVK